MVRFEEAIHRVILDQPILFYETEGIRLLARLDRMKMIELQPGNRVKLMISQNFEWLPGGPIQKYFESTVQQEFLSSAFNKPGELRIFASGMISPAANAELTRKMHNLAKEMHDMNRFLPDAGHSSLGSSGLQGITPLAG